MKKFIVTFMIAAMAAATLTGCGSKSDAKAKTSDAKVSGAVSVVSREDGSGTRGAFIELFGIEEKDAEGNKADLTTTEAVIANSTEIVLSNVAGDPNAIGYISLGSLNSQVKALKIDGAKASVDTIKDGTYKVSRPFSIATSQTISDAARDFVNFILSAEGQKVVEDNGYIASVDNAESFRSNHAAGKVTVAGSSSVTPVMEKLKEAYESANKEANIEINQSDSTTGLNAVMDKTADIGMASRELKDSESSLTAAVIAIDGIAVVVNNENPVENMTTDEIKAIFTGERTDW